MQLSSVHLFFFFFWWEQVGRGVCVWAWRVGGRGGVQGPCLVVLPLLFNQGYSLLSGAGSLL